ncbi:MAG: hypothetical protein ACK4SX_00015 [Alcanivoracaceae bacterium]
MVPNSLQTLLSRRNQRFTCTAAGRQNDAFTFTARITHEVTGGLSQEDIDELEIQIGHQDQLFAVLSTFGSIRLYCDTLSDDSAFYLAHPYEWESLENNFRLWLDDLDDDERAELLPDWLEDAVVIGEIPSSGNYFLFPIAGDHQGKVFEFEHDGFEFIEAGTNLYSFIDYLCTVTDRLIANVRSHTRYSDGKTDIQWLANSYTYES